MEKRPSSRQPTQPQAPGHCLPFAFPLQAWGLLSSQGLAVTVARTLRYSPHAVPGKMGQDEGEMRGTWSRRDALGSGSCQLPHCRE